MVILAKRLLIIGAGGHGRVVADLATCLGYDQVAFVDQRWPALAQNLIWPVIGFELPHDMQGWSVAVAIGQNEARLTAFNQLQNHGIDLPNLVHPSAYVSKHANLGKGIVVAAQAVIGVGCKVGDVAIINTSATVDHDCVIGDGVHVSPGAHLAGTVKVGLCTWIGIGASVREGMEIGKNVVVGAGAAVVTELEDGVRVGGVPARKLD